MKFVIDRNDSLTMGYTDLELENYNDIHDLRISFNKPKWEIYGDIKISLDRYAYTFDGLHWKSIDFHYLDLDKLKLDNFSSSLTWNSKKKVRLETDIIKINFLLDYSDGELSLTEVRTHGDLSVIKKKYGVILNKFNILVIKKILKEGR